LFEHQLDEVATAMAAFPSRSWPEFHAHWTTKVLPNESGTVRAVLVDGVLAGNMVCFRQGDELEVGYWIGRAFWGSGVATDALGQFLRVVTERPLHAHVARHNVGSIRVLEKCGFVPAYEQRTAIADEPPIDEVVLVLT
jgi:RimJ/RimL family protein N-acetyltransferase